MAQGETEGPWPTPEDEARDRHAGAPEWTAYHFAARHAAGLRVLDCACGPGYGTWLLSRAGAASVIGVDVDADALAWAGRYFAAPGVHFRQGDGRALPLGSGEVQLAVSLETIEHLRDAGGFVEELSRVLSPGGTLVLSTPLTRGEARLRPANPRHAREFDEGELAALLEPRFALRERLGMQGDRRGGQDDLRARPGGLSTLLRSGAHRVLPEPLRAVGRSLLARAAGKSPRSSISADGWETAPIQLVVATRL